MNLLVASAIILGACAVTSGLLFAFHRYGKRDALLSDTTRGAGVYSVVGTSFAVLLAFVVFVAFGSYSQAREGAEEEADAVLEMSRTAEFFPAGQGRDMKGELICYGRAVAFEDWPEMENQRGSETVNAWTRTMQESLVALRVETVKEEVAFGNLLSLRDDRINARRQRLTQAVPIITTPVWFILALGAILNIAFVLMFVDRRSESLGIQVMLMASVTTIVVAGLLLVWFLDHPYEDHSGSIQPIEIQRTVNAMEGEADGLAAPCNQRGDPLS